MVIGFWNLNKKNLSDLIVDFTLENDLDIICLAEVVGLDIAKFLGKLNGKSSGSNFEHIACSKDKVIVISRFDPSVFQDLSSNYNSTRLLAFKVKIPSKIEFNLVPIHFHSKNNWSDMSLALECATASQAILKIEQIAGENKTIVIGDFNMNPFEVGMVAANGFHAIPDLAYAVKKKGRSVDKTHYPFFYNPMWSSFGDSAKPFGTYYFRASGNVSYEWHIFDQVLFRPSLKKFLAKDYIKIIKTIGSESLINSLNRPDHDQYSDHLPIVFKLNI